MARTKARLATATLVAVAIALIAGCGSSNHDSTSDQSAITVDLSAKPDYLDPALTYSTEGWMLLWNVYTPLLTYRHDEGAAGSKLIPGLAKALPTVSADGRTYRLTLRPGLHYSDGTPVRASDFEHEIKRVLTLESGGSSFFDPVVGAEAYTKAHKPTANLPGITSDDAAGTITIRLTQPVGSFSNVLATTFAAPVPASTPFTNQSAHPPAGVGAFTLTNSSSTGVTLQRDPDFTGLPGIAPAKLARVDVDYVHSQQRQAEDVLENRVDLMYDAPPTGMLSQIKSKAADRFATYPTNATYFFFLNQREKPFTDQRVREAVNYAVDKRAIARLFGGLLQPSCNFLPPDVPGYRKLDPCPYGDPTKAPDLARARQLVRQAGAEGAKVAVWGNDNEPSRSVTEYVADAMSRAGLDATPKIVSSSVYFQTIGNQSSHAQAGDANWVQDYPHPSDFFFLLDGRSIQPTNSTNFGNVDDPQINDLLRRADPNPDVEAVAGLYAQADARAVRRAYLIPYGDLELTKFVSDRVSFPSVVANPVFGIDLSQITR